MKILQRKHNKPPGVKKRSTKMIPTTTTTTPKMIESPYKRKRNQSFFVWYCFLFLIALYFACILFITTTKIVTSSSSLLRGPQQKPPTNCQNFDQYGNLEPLSNTTKSIFNCNTQYGLCKYYYPAIFFHRECGIGKDYTYLLDVLESLRLNCTLWLDMPPIILEWVSFPGTSAVALQSNSNYNRRKGNNNKKRKLAPNSLEYVQLTKSNFQKQNISMIHVHKSGGTSLVFSFGKLHHPSVHFPGKQFLVYPHIVQQLQHFKKNIIKDGGGEPGYLKKRNETFLFLDGATKYKSEWDKNDHTIFAVVRDPVERFISSIGQAVGGKGSPRSFIAKELAKLCLSIDDNDDYYPTLKNRKKRLTPRSILKCFAKQVQRRGTLIEVHFTPQVIEISFASMYKDIPIAIFPFSELSSILNELGADSELKRKDGQSDGQRTNNILKHLSVDDYDEDILNIVCTVYKVDVLFLWSLGYATRCDNIVTFSSSHE